MHQYVRKFVIIMFIRYNYIMSMFSWLLLYMFMFWLSLHYLLIPCVLPCCISINLSYLKNQSYRNVYIYSVPASPLRFMQFLIAAAIFIIFSHYFPVQIY